MLGEGPVLSLPARVFYHKATLFDVIFQGILAGESLTGKEIGLLGQGWPGIVTDVILQFGLSGKVRLRG